MSLNSHSTAQTLLSLRYCARLHAWFHSTMTLTDTWGLGPGHGHQLVCVGRDLAPLRSGLNSYGVRVVRRVGWAGQQSRASGCSLA